MLAFLSKQWVLDLFNWKVSEKTLRHQQSTRWWFEDPKLLHDFWSTRLMLLTHSQQASRAAPKLLMMVERKKNEELLHWMFSLPGTNIRSFYLLLKKVLLTDHNRAAKEKHHMVSIRMIYFSFTLQKNVFILIIFFWWRTGTCLLSQKSYPSYKSFLNRISAIRKSCEKTEHYYDWISAKSQSNCMKITFLVFHKAIV